jgi:Protein of unknown function (DUF3987)
MTLDSITVPAHDSFLTPSDRSDSVDSSHEWSEVSPEIISEFRQAAPKFPTVVLGPWAEMIAAEALSRSVPVDYVAAALLTTTASLIGNSYWIKAGNWEQPAVLWIGNVGDSSSGKTPAIKPFTEALGQMEAGLAAEFETTRRIFEGQYEAAKVAQEVWQAQVKDAVNGGLPTPSKPAAADTPEEPRAPRLKLNDATQEAAAKILTSNPKGLYQIRDELAGLLNGMDSYKKGNDRQFYLEAYDGGDFVVDRVRQDGKPAIIPRLTMSILGGIQPDKLTSLILSGDDDGLAARFLFFFAEMAPLGLLTAEDTGAFGPYSPIRKFMDRLCALEVHRDDNGCPSPIMLPLDVEAYKPFQQFRIETRAQCHAASGMLKSHFGKLPGTALRLALVFEFLAMDSSEKPLPSCVSKQSLILALHFIDDYAKPMAQHVYGSMHLNKEESSAIRIFRSLKASKVETINVSEMGRRVVNGVSFPRIKNTSDRDKAMQVLIEHGVVRYAPSRAGGSKGKQTNSYVVNPRIVEGNN